MARAAELAHAAGALVFVDGVHAVPHRLADVRGSGCDFFACSAYKVYGPHVGVLYGKRDLLQSLDFPRLLPASDAPPERAETGTLNHEGIVGAAAAVEWIGSLAAGESLRGRLSGAYDGLHRRGTDLTAQLWDGLASVTGVKLYGPAPGAPRTPTVAFTVNGQPSSVVARHLAGRGIFLSHGDFYAATVIARLGLASEGLVRAGCACYTTPDDVARLVDGIQTIA
jgi:selenocysteine lyase/cysteine desulfurase